MSCQGWSSAGLGMFFHGQEIKYEDIVFKRPGTGIPADRLHEVIGRHVNHDMEADKTIFWEDLVK